MLLSSTDKLIAETLRALDSEEPIAHVRLQESAPEKETEIAEASESNTIFFRNWTQKALWDNEISGQISDGHWENSNNSNYKFWTSLKTDVDGAKPRVDAQTWNRVNFNLTNSDLLDAVGDRMIATAKMSKISRDEKVIAAAGGLEGIKTPEEYAKRVEEAEEYEKKYFDLISPELFAKWLEVVYTEANLKSDLRDMSDIMKTAASSSYGAGGKTAAKVKTGFEEKDVKRVEDIVTKAKGSEEKEAALALSMANKITDGRKALQRSAAASSISKENIAKVFTARAKELGIVEDTDQSVKEGTEITEANKYKVDAPETTSEREKSLGTVSFADPINGKIRISKSTSEDGEWNVRRVPNKSDRPYKGYQAPSQNILLGAKIFEEALEAVRTYLAKRAKKASVPAFSADEVAKITLKIHEYVKSIAASGDTQEAVNDAVMEIGDDKEFADKDATARFTQYQNEVVNHIYNSLDEYLEGFVITFPKAK